MLDFHVPDRDEVVVLGRKTMPLLKELRQSTNTRRSEPEGVEDNTSVFSDEI